MTFIIPLLLIEMLPTGNLSDSEFFNGTWQIQVVETKVTGSGSSSRRIFNGRFTFDRDEQLVGDLEASTVLDLDGAEVGFLAMNPVFGELILINGLDSAFILLPTERTRNRIVLGGYRQIPGGLAAKKDGLKTRIESTVIWDFEDLTEDAEQVFDRSLFRAGTLVGTTIVSGRCEDTKAVGFDGNAFVDFGENSVLGTQDFTITMLVRVDDLSQGASLFNTETEWLQLGLDTDGTLELVVGKQAIRSPPGIVEPSKWHEIEARREGLELGLSTQQVAIFVDDVKVAEGSERPRSLPLGVDPAFRIGEGLVGSADYLQIRGFIPESSPIGLDNPCLDIFGGGLGATFSSSTTGFTAAMHQGAAGLWFVPEAPGDGFNVIQTDDTIIILYFGYQVSGAPLWLISETVSEDNFLVGDTVAMTMLSAGSGSFLRPGDPAALPEWGQLEFALENCLEASFRLVGADGEKVFNARRLAGVDGNDCEFIGDD